MSARVAYSLIALLGIVIVAASTVYTADGHLSNEITPAPTSTPTMTNTPRPTPPTFTPTPTATPTPIAVFAPVVMRNVDANAPRPTPTAGATP